MTPPQISIIRSSKSQQQQQRQYVILLKDYFLKITILAGILNVKKLQLTKYEHVKYVYNFFLSLYVSLSSYHPLTP